MRNLDKNILIEKIKNLCIEINQNLSQDVLDSYQNMLKTETSSSGQNILKEIITNAEIAKKECQPLCQDTGFAVFFIELGRELILDFDLEEAVNEGVRQGYETGYFRKSIVQDPITRINTKDNTPAIIHLKSVAGDKIKIALTAKGGGAENMSQLKMCAPSEGLDGVKDFIIETVKKAGANACPPLVIGVGIGGTFEKVALLAKEALSREIGSQNIDPFYNKVEKELLIDINKLGIGPMGLGGKTTALSVFINTFPCHIASLPVAVNIQCHSARHKEVII